MDDKYYNPSLEEFYIGFEFEFQTGIDGWKIFLLKKDKIDATLKNVNEFKVKFRVKYLDRKDIESLGFNDYEHGPSDWYKLEKRVPDGYASYGYWNCFRLVHNYDTHKIKIIAYEYGFNEKDKHTLFQGSCKNKSELKKLMSQLGIA